MMTTEAKVGKNSAMLHLAETLAQLEKSIREIKVLYGRDEVGARELALCYTCLQEARLWFQESARIRMVEV